MDNSLIKSETPLSAAELMDRYGIRCIPTDQFHYKSFCHSTLSAAVAQAKRDAVASTSTSNAKSKASTFCRDQEAWHRDRLASEALVNVKLISHRAADAWARQAVRAERREAKIKAASAEVVSDTDRQLSENPDRGFTT